MQTWQAVRVSAQIDDWLVWVQRRGELWRCLIKQLLDAPIEGRLVADHSLVQGRGEGLPDWF